MGKQDGLPGLKMGIARKHHPHVLLGFGDNRSLQITDRFNNFLDCVSRVKSDIQLRLIVAGTGRVHLSAHRSHDFRDAPLNGHLNVFVRYIKYKFAVLNFLTDGLQTLENRFGF